MILAASGTPLDVGNQIQAIRSQLIGRGGGRGVVAFQTPTLQHNAAPPPADTVSLAWSNGALVQS